MIGKDPKPVPEGYMNVELPPQQTGLREPRYVVMKKEVLERSIDPETGQDRAIPKVKGAPFDRKLSILYFNQEQKQSKIILLS